MRTAPCPFSMPSWGMTSGSIGGKSRSEIPDRLFCTGKRVKAFNPFFTRFHTYKSILCSLVDLCYLVGELIFGLYVNEFSTHPSASMAAGGSTSFESRFLSWGPTYCTAICTRLWKSRIFERSQVCKFSSHLTLRDRQTREVFKFARDVTQRWFCFPGNCEDLPTSGTLYATTLTSDSIRKLI